MVEVDQCRVVLPPSGGPFTVKHSRSCTSEYCLADYQAEQANRRKLRHREVKNG